MKAKKSNLQTLGNILFQIAKYKIGTCHKSIKTQKIKFAIKWFLPQSSFCPVKLDNSAPNGTKRNMLFP